jgi:DNA-directed RNA polymerase specialized sigma24 family protein
MPDDDASPSGYGDASRARAAAREAGGTDVAAPDRSPEELVLTHDRDVKTMAALLRLPDRSRTLLTLLLDAGLSYGQVSAQLRMPVDSIGPTRARSLELLRHELAAVGIDGDALIG